MNAKTYKLPVSVLVVVHTPDLQVLLLERADRPGFWQSLTGSQHAGETLQQTAVRELREESLALLLYLLGEGKRARSRTGAGAVPKCLRRGTLDEVA